MKERPKQSASPVVVIALVLFALLLPLLYVLSIGPVVWLANHGWFDVSTVESFYFPVEWLHDRSQGFALSFGGT